MRGREGKGEEGGGRRVHMWARAGGFPIGGLSGASLVWRTLKVNVGGPALKQLEGVVVTEVGQKQRRQLLGPQARLRRDSARLRFCPTERLTEGLSTSMRIAGVGIVMVEILIWWA